jgi:tudor domain-containing protein 1/4/6/7
LYFSSGTPLTITKTNKLCACKSIKNNSWCRAQVLSLSNQQVKVKYIDFGHTETVLISDLRILEPQFVVNVSILKLYIPYKCIDETQKSAVTTEVATLTKGYILSMDLVQPYNNVWIGGVSHLGVSMDQLLIYKKMVQPIDIPAICSQIDENEPIALHQPTFHIENCMLGFISHVEDPENFYVQLKTNTDALDSVQENLQIVAPSLPELQNFDVGTECIANYHLDGNWYRSIITDSNEEKIGEITITVQFCDYGNKSDYVIAAGEKQLLLKEKKYQETYTYFAKLCSLPIKKTQEHKDDSWDAATELLKKLIDEEIFFEPVTASRSHQFINLFHKTENVTNFLIENELAEELDLIVSDTTCFVSHVNSVSEFFIQYEKDGDKLDEMAGILGNNENFPLLEGSIEVGQICAAVFPDDECWYRSMILSQSENIVEVLYIDYGNHATVSRSKLKQLPEACALVPALAIKCSLELPIDVFKWSDEAELQFKDLTNAGETIFTIQLIEPDDPSVVHLWLDGENIGQQLALSCEKVESNFDMITKSIQEDLKNSMKGPVQVVLFISPIDFHIQFKNGAAALDSIGKFFFCLKKLELYLPFIGYC